MSLTITCPRCGVDFPVGLPHTPLLAILTTCPNGHDVTVLSQEEKA